MSKKSIEDQYKKLSDIEHVLLRPGRYLGSVKPHTAFTWIFDEESGKMIKKSITWNPALLKMFDEVITNSVDASKKNSKLNTIKIHLNRETGEIVIWDNGGIPVEIHKDHKQYVPEMIFGELRSGSNFDDDEVSFGAGQNGEGTTLVNIFSKKYIVKTCDGKKLFRQTFSENLHKRTKPTINFDTRKYTEIKFIPDYDRLGVSMDEGNTLKIIKRVYDVAACNPKLKISLGGKLIRIKSFKDYIQLYTDDFVFTEDKFWKVGVSSSDGSFEHVSFVNTTETTTGGTHVNLVAAQIIDQIRFYIKKKHKIDVRPSEIRNHMTLFIDVAIVNPRYDSQTKTTLETEVRDMGSIFEPDDKFINKIIKSDIIQDVLDWAEAKREADEKKEQRKLNKDSKRNNPRGIEKFSDANEKKNRYKCILALAEGDSASKALQSARDRNSKYFGSYPLKGKPLNVRDVDLKKLMKNEEFVNLMTILGIGIGDKIVDPSELYFGKIAFMTDQDVDGTHIRGLLINLFYKHWPEMFELGMIYFFRTPLIKVYKGKKVIGEFFDEVEFDAWKEKNSRMTYTSKYFKGLGSHNTEDFKRYLNDLDKYLVPITIEGAEDIEAINLAFDKTRADDRKVWLGLEENEN